MTSRVKYNDLENCLKISNGEATLFLATDIGPRILAYGLDEGENILGWHPEAAVDTAFGTWKPYGGHRLWIAPEQMPLSYAPDSTPVERDTDGELSVRLSGGTDAAGVNKEMVITMAETGTAVTIEHRLTVLYDEPKEFAAWALTILRPGGEVVIPNERFAPYSPDHLLPVRSMSLWSYTDLTDPRWRFTKDDIRLRVDENINTKQKLGVHNTRGWAAYEWQDLRFTKHFDHVDGAVYPDMNSNLEVYTDGGFVELETLSPLVKAEPGKTIVHVEKWELTKTVNSE